nr:SEC-C metal-binding domain-containing protein [Heliomicrobium undosum]
MNKIGRNDPCPCSSGKKYKKCCMSKKDDDEFTKPVNFLRNYKELKRESKIKQCLHPCKDECSERIIGAHSLQNNKILKQISDNGCVYMPYPKNDNPFAVITKWGRKEATVFTGFCGYHDNELFKPIENNTFDYSDEHIFLYTYRCFALGYHRKLENVNLQHKILGRRPSLIGIDDIDQLFLGEKLAVSDLEECKEVFDRAIISKQYNVLTSVVWKFEKTINFAASGHTALCKDLNGELVQDIMDIHTPMKHVFFTVFPEGDKTLCLLSWVKNKHDIFANYKSQLLNLSDNERIIYLNNLIPMEAENIVIKPSAWESFQSDKKDEFGALMWGMGQFSDMIGGESYNMLESPSFNLFEL